MSKKHIPDSSCQYFNEKEETLTREQIEALQLERLQATVKHCMNSPFYKKRFEEAGLKPEDIKTLDDVRKIPFTTKQDLRETYPFGPTASSSEPVSGNSVSAAGGPPK